MAPDHTPQIPHSQSKLTFGLITPPNPRGPLQTCRAAPYQYRHRLSYGSRCTSCRGKYPQMFDTATAFYLPDIIILSAPCTELSVQHPGSLHWNIANLSYQIFPRDIPYHLLCQLKFQRRNLAANLSSQRPTTEAARVTQPHLSWNKSEESSLKPISQKTEAAIASATGMPVSSRQRQTSQQAQLQPEMMCIYPASQFFSPILKYLAT